MSVSITRETLLLVGSFLYLRGNEIDYPSHDNKSFLISVSVQLLTLRKKVHILCDIPQKECSLILQNPFFTSKYPPFDTNGNPFNPPFYLVRSPFRGREPLLISHDWSSDKGSGPFSSPRTVF